MSKRSVGRCFMPRCHSAGAIGFSLMMVMNLSLGQGVAQDSLTVSETAPVAAYGPSEPTATDDALREQVEREGWVLVHVDLRQSEENSSVPEDTDQAAILQNDLEWMAQDLLFALPAGSYDRVQREPGSPGLTLRVDAAGLDELLVSPLVAAVTATGNAAIARIAAGPTFSLALRTDGSLWAWGDNNLGQMGNGTYGIDRLIPGQVLTGVAAMAGGREHALASQTDRKTSAWGNNLDGYLGDGTTVAHFSPGPVLTGLSQILTSSAVAAGWWHSLAINSGTTGGGRLSTWGNNLHGQLGDGTIERRLNPVWVSALGDRVAAASAGEYHSLALTTDGSVWAWGDNYCGQLGDGTLYTSGRRIPYQVMSGAKAVAAGQVHSLAVKEDGTLWAWGQNLFGQIGDGTYAWRETPVQVLTGVAAVAAGATHTLALKTDGSLWAWGNNIWGAIGDGTRDTRRTPTQVLSGVAAMAAGGWHSLAIKTDGSLWAWGANGDGQLGDGTTTYRLSPVQVSGFVPKPDFVVTSLVLTPSAPVANGTFSAAVTVKNQSTVAGTPGTLQVWANQAAGQNCGAVGDKFMNLSSSLAAGASQTVTLSGLPAGTAGAKTLRAFVDSNCWTEEPNEVNNQYTKAYTVAPPAPNFAVTGLVLTPSAPIANGTFSATVTVKNQGTLAGAARTLQVWANQATVQNCGAVGNKSTTLTNLAAGASQTVTLSGLPAGTAGPKTLRAFVDSGCLTAEANEGNNQATKTYTVLPPAPDFVVTSLVLTPSAPIANGTFSVAVTVKNQGTLARAPGTLQVWANQAAGQKCGAVGNKSTTLTNLAAGASQTVTLSGLPAGTAGAKTLRAFVDSGCLTAEANETNNQATKTYAVAPPAPDFVVTSLVLTPSAPIANGTFSAAVTVKNQGTLARAPGTLQVWANQAAVQNCGAVGNKSTTLTNLAAGASQTVTLSGLPAGTVGAKTLRAFVDSYCDAREASDANNQAVKAYRVVP
ncbi:hypothetical protein CCR95_24255 [Thiocystis minor]|uniref:RCC1 domain-containing protein n=1 Tax=Thiocystis minor TaxID=61597 RepID=UPI00191260AD|nr:CARDB domain-containing protein [Thiocystis minor]MBK5967096.1 hypothetical protein [Thiocystis minor]